MDLETTAMMVVVSGDNFSGCHRTSRFVHGSSNQIERERERERERNKREIWVQRLPLLVVEASCVEGAQRVLVMKVGKREISKTL